jgi:hypothetical protein
VSLFIIDGENEECNNPIVGLTVGLFVVILLGGLISILVYKTCILIADRREYARYYIMILN